MADLRALPSIDQLINEKGSHELISQFGRPAVLESFREYLDEIRQKYVLDNRIPEKEKILWGVNQILNQKFAPTLVPVINATGVILHTNLGRAPLSSAAIESIRMVSEGYSTLEFDLDNGQRGERSIHTENYLQKISGAEAAMVVNNNAAALWLILTVFARRKRVIVSRTQLIEIGGSFRIPDIMAQSGVKQVEVGTTNRVHLEDYQKELQLPTAAVLHTHHSNFKVLGFTSEPSIKELSSLTAETSVLLIADLGSGVLINTEAFGLEHELTVQEVIASHADLVCFSGDKLLGGPQAGIIVGKKILIDKIKKHPMARALRADKLCLAGLSATLEHYLKDEALIEIPVWQMISRSKDEIKDTATAWVKDLGKGELIESQSAIGGGSLPGETLPTTLLGLQNANPNKLLKKLRRLRVPIIARIENNKVVFDPRTILKSQNTLFISELKSLVTAQL